MAPWSVRSCRSLRRRWSPSGGFWLRPPWSSTTPLPPASYPRPQKYIISSTSETSPRYLTSCVMCDCLSSGKGANYGLGTPNLSEISLRFRPIDSRKMKQDISVRAARYIACDCHVHLVSKAGSMISNKSPSRAFRWSGIYYTEP